MRRNIRLMGLLPCDTLMLNNCEDCSNLKIKKGSHGQVLVLDELHNVAEHAIWSEGLLIVVSFGHGCV